MGRAGWRRRPEWDGVAHRAGGEEHKEAGEFLGSTTPRQLGGEMDQHEGLWGAWNVLGLGLDEQRVHCGWRTAVYDGSITEGRGT